MLETFVQFKKPLVCSPVGVLLVLDVQVFERGDEGLSLEAPGGSRGNRRVADGAICADGGDIAPQWCSKVSRLIPGLSNAANVEATAEINTVQDLRETAERMRHERRHKSGYSGFFLLIGFTRKMFSFIEPFYPGILGRHLLIAGKLLPLS